MEMSKVVWNCRGGGCTAAPATTADTSEYFIRGRGGAFCALLSHSPRLGRVIYVWILFVIIIGQWWVPVTSGVSPYNLLKSSKWSNFGFGLQVQRAGQNQVKCESKSRKRLPRCTVVLLLTNKTNLNQDCTPDCNHTDSHKVYHRYYSYYRLMQCRSTRDQEYKRHSFSSMDIAENNVLLQNSIWFLDRAEIQLLQMHLHGPGQK